MALMATTPPLRRLASALTTTSPLGAKVTARSSSTGGFSFSFPTHVAPSDVASLRWDSPLVETYTSHFQDCRTAMVRLAEEPKPKRPTRSPGSTPATRRLRNPMMPAQSRGATCMSSKPPGRGTVKSARASAYSAYPPSTVYPVKVGRSHRFSILWRQYQQSPSTPPIQETPTREPTGDSLLSPAMTSPTIWWP